MFESYRFDTQTLASSLREITATLHLNLPLGVTNEEREAIKLISGAVAGEANKLHPSTLAPSLAWFEILLRSLYVHIGFFSCELQWSFTKLCLVIKSFCLFTDGMSIIKESTMSNISNFIL